MVKFGLGSKKNPFSIFVDMKQFQFRLNELKDGLKSVFSDRTDSASAVQYFQVLVTKVFLSDS